MINITLNVDRHQLDRVKEELYAIPGGALRASVAAVNETARWGRTQVVRALVEEIVIKRREVAGRVALKQASRGAPSAEITVSGKRIPLMAWGARPARVRNTRRSRTPISYQINRRTGRTTLPGGFVMALGKSGRLWVMVRKGKARFPVRAPYGPSIPQVTEDAPSTKRIINVDLSARLRRSLDSKVDWLLNRKKGQPLDAPSALGGGA